MAEFGCDWTMELFTVDELTEFDLLISTVVDGIFVIFVVVVIILTGTWVVEVVGFSVVLIVTDGVLSGASSS